MKKLTLLTALLTLLLSACGSVGSMSASSVKPQLEEARALNSELRADWEATETMLNDTEKAIEDFPKIEVDKSKLDINLLKEAMTECFNSPLEAAKDSMKSGDIAAGDEAATEGAEKVVATCEGENMNALNDLKGQSDPEVAQFIDQKVTSVATIKVNIKQGLPTRSESLVKKYPEAKVQLEKIKKTAEGVKLAFEKNPLNGADDKKKFNDEYAELETEIKGLEELLSSMETEIPNLPDRVSKTAINFNEGLANFGQ
jgi:hypothetical protein